MLFKIHSLFGIKWQISCEWHLGKGRERNGHGLIYGNILPLALKDWESLQKISARIANLTSHFKYRTSKTGNRSANHWHLHINFLKDPFQYYPAIYIYVSQVVSSFLVFQSDFCMHFSHLPANYCSAHLILPDLIILIIFCKY